MQHYLSLDPVKLENTWLTIGSFDGVHLGHQQIVKALVESAHAHHNPAAVVTFFPHPAVVLGKGNGGYLTTPEERAELLGALGVDAVVTMTFTREVAALTALEFMQLMKAHFDLRRLMIGYDFALGKGREGNFERLREIGKELGYEVGAYEPVEIDGAPVSSSQVRKLLRGGQVEAASRLLGRWYDVSGTVIHGDGRGKLIGVPTANLDYWNERVLPASGVYATWAWIDGERYASVSNLGLRPTFENVPAVPQLEAHLLDFNQDLYGRAARLEFVSRLRPEVKFGSVDALIDQINHDKQKAREVLGHAR